jgi:hypothetical protein
MRSKIIAGLMTTIAAASIAGPAMAQAPAAPTLPAGANGPQVHISSCKVQTSHKGYVYATCGLGSINMGKQTVYVQYHSNMKAFEPVTGGEFSSTSGILGFPGNGKVSNTYSLRFAFKNKTAAQVRKSLKVTISNATGGALITSATATAAS